ncbi:hypothetical protein [Bacillus cereus]
MNDVDLIQLVIPEAVAHLLVNGFQSFVTMDSHGKSLNEDVDKL